MSSNNAVTKIPSNRLPAPSLFVGPPSRNASNTSLGLHPPPTQPSATRTPLVRQRSLLTHDPSKRPQGSNDPEMASVSPIAGPFARRQQQQAAAVEAESNSRADAIWAEMQNTLEEVELSAIKGPGLTVFGPEHSKALDDLRRAQIELAKAWARSDAEEEGQGQEERVSAQGTDAADMLSHDRSEKLGGLEGHRERRPSGTNERSRLEEETEKDIELSRKRREANDRYFEKVNKGVLEVVFKLEEVARAMKGVEDESKEIWRDGESVDEIASVRTGSVRTGSMT